MEEEEIAREKFQDFSSLNALTEAVQSDASILFAILMQLNWFLMYVMFV
jgi:hypothetical protein